ncbi:osteopontin isoform X2 [Pungitius pungitius]|uniref:osteopontin isoform X2 n=1 Tax=Pungitius pungitius TaxID=134920 RepID=UPI002E166685
MKVALVFVLLFATVLCRPARKVSVSSSESSEEVNRAPAAPPLSQKAAEVPQYREAPAENAAVGSDESTEGSDEDEAASEDVTDPTSFPESASDNQDSEDSDDDDVDDDDDDAEESETEDDDTSESSESGESSTPAPATVEPVTVTDESLSEFTDEPILPTIVTDTDAARGDSLGAYPGDHKSIVYVEDKSYHKVPSPYKSYEFMGKGKKMAYDMTEGNEVDNSLKVFKVLHVHNDLLEEDTSTPEVESQSLDASQDQEISPRQASIPEEEDSTGNAGPGESESSSTPEDEEEEEKQNESTSQESEAENSQSNEETADSESDESAGSDSDEDGAGLDTTTDLPAVLTAK